MRIVDTRGQRCPAPLIATKRALAELQEGESFKVLTDNQISLGNLTRFLRDNKTEYTFDDSGGILTLTITKTTSVHSLKPDEVRCTAEIPHFTKGDFIIVFSSDVMGAGDDELGHTLIRNFIKAIKDLEILPAKMIFYNRGVILGTEGSPVIDHLKELEAMGIELLICATCVNHFSLENKIKTGILSNMFEIAQVMSSASSIVRP